MKFEFTKKTFVIIILVIFLVMLLSSKNEKEFLTLKTYNKHKKIIKPKKQKLAKQAKKLGNKEEDKFAKLIDDKLAIFQELDEKENDEMSNYIDAKSEILQEENNELENKIIAVEATLNILKNQQNELQQQILDTKNIKIKQADLINGIKLSNQWSSYPDDKLNGSEISNDTNAFKELMIVGNRSSGEKIRRVGVWDKLSVHGDLSVDGNLVSNNPNFSGIKISNVWTGYPDNKLNGSEISNDTNAFKELMIVGNKSAGENARKVGVWDKLTVHGALCIDDVCINRSELARMKR